MWPFKRELEIKEPKQYLEKIGPAGEVFLEKEIVYENGKYIRKIRLMTQWTECKKVSQWNEKCLETLRFGCFQSLPNSDRLLLMRGCEIRTIETEISEAEALTALDKWERK